MRQQTALELELERIARVCSCGDVIAFVRGELGGRIPVELDEVSDGDVELTLSDEIVAHVVRVQPVHELQLGLELDVPIETVELGPRYRSHWQSCPHAKDYRP